ncbi:MAG: UDP-glucose 6-dehydrogenase, partial [Rhizobiaceae bacterium]|nr:UDP-glucose 6-dehydrogenase [Rhizobiaceae bacterium]
TDDMREAPSRVLMEALWEVGARVRAYDPVAMDQCRSIYGNRADLELVDSKEKALEGADALVICTEWKAFKAPDFALVKDRLSRPLVFDGRNIYDPAIMSRNGFTYHGVGRLVPPAA